ncbi:MAG: hypothetical protein QM755_22330 [Luteolibacter sp.]
MTSDSSASGTSVHGWLSVWKKLRRARAGDWRVGHLSRDSLYYEEWLDGEWKRLVIDGEMLCGKGPHHVIYFASPAQWQDYPEWARHRRREIIDRIKSKFREPGYEYEGDD